MSAIIKMPKDKEKYQKTMKAIESLKKYGIRGEDFTINNDSFYGIPLQGLGPEKRMTLGKVLYELRKNHGITTGILTHTTDVVKKLVKEGKLSLP